MDGGRDRGRGRTCGDGFLAEDVLAGSGTSLDLVGVVLGGGADPNSVHVGVADYLVQRQVERGGWRGGACEWLGRSNRDHKARARPCSTHHSLSSRSPSLPVCLPAHLHGVVGKLLDVKLVSRIHGLRQGRVRDDNGDGVGTGEGKGGGGEGRGMRGQNPRSATLFPSGPPLLIILLLAFDDFARYGRFCLHAHTYANKCLRSTVQPSTLPSLHFLGSIPFISPPQHPLTSSPAPPSVQYQCGPRQ